MNTNAADIYQTTWYTQMFFTPQTQKKKKKKNFTVPVALIKNEGVQGERKRKTNFQ